MLRKQLQAITGEVNNERIYTQDRGIHVVSALTQNEKRDRFSFTEHRLPINRNHKSATQQHVNLRAAVTPAQGLMATVATEVTLS